MATIEKRLAVTPSPTAGPVLRELSKLTGEAPAAIVRQLLDEALPALLVTVEALRVVHKRPEAAQAALYAYAAKATRDLGQAQLDLNEALKKRPGRKPGSKPGRGAANTG